MDHMISETQTFESLDKQIVKNEAHEIMLQVCAALREKGYNPVNQIVGYILSGDPTYITSFKDARANICRLERDELLEEVVTYYLRSNLKMQ